MISFVLLLDLAGPPIYFLNFDRCAYGGRHDSSMYTPEHAKPVCGPPYLASSGNCSEVFTFSWGVWKVMRKTRRNGTDNDRSIIKCSCNGSRILIIQWIVLLSLSFSACCLVANFWRVETFLLVSWTNFEPKFLFPSANDNCFLFSRPTHVIWVILKSCVVCESWDNVRSWIWGWSGRVIFDWISKVSRITLVLIYFALVIGIGNSRHAQKKSDVKQNSVATLSLAFSRSFAFLPLFTWVFTGYLWCKPLLRLSVAITMVLVFGQSVENWLVKLNLF